MSIADPIGPTVTPARISGGVSSPKKPNPCPLPYEGRGTSAIRADITVMALSVDARVSNLSRACGLFRRRKPGESPP